MGGLDADVAGFKGRVCWLRDVREERWELWGLAYYMCSSMPAEGTRTQQMPTSWFHWCKVSSGPCIPKLH